MLLNQGYKHSQHQIQIMLLTQGWKHSLHQLQNMLLTQGYKHSQHQIQNMLLTQGCKHSQHQLLLRFFIQTHLQNAFPHCAWHFVSCNTQYSLRGMQNTKFGSVKHTNKEFHFEPYSSRCFLYPLLNVYIYIMELQNKYYFSGTDLVPVLSIFCPCAQHILSLCSAYFIPVLRIFGPCVQYILSMCSAYLVPVLSIFCPCAQHILSLCSAYLVPVLIIFCSCAQQIWSLCSAAHATRQNYWVTEWVRYAKTEQCHRAHNSLPLVPNLSQ